MTARTTANKTSNGSQILEGLTIVLLFLTLFFPPIGVIGLIFMFLWTKWKKWMKIVLSIPILIFCFWIFSYIFLYRPFQIIGSSMVPNYQSGEYVLSQIYHGSINRDDVVIFTSPQDAGTYLIKRIIGMPGDTVMIQNGNVYINGSILDENNYLPAATKTYITQDDLFTNGIPVQVPSGYYFVLGDGRSVSTDSRKFGFVPRKNIISKVVFCYWNCQ